MNKRKRERKSWERRNHHHHHRDSRSSVKSERWCKRIGSTSLSEDYTFYFHFSVAMMMLVMAIIGAYIRSYTELIPKLSMPSSNIKNLCTNPHLPLIYVGQLHVICIKISARMRSPIIPAYRPLLVKVKRASVINTRIPIAILLAFRMNHLFLKVKVGR